MATTQRPLELFSPEELWKRSLLAKIEGLIPWQVYDHLSRCGVDEIYRTCKSCHDWQTFYYRCSLKFCPLCNWRIARARAQLLKVWTQTIKQPKHVVLTQRNFPILTRKKIRQFQKAFARLRRSRLFRDVTGGCISIEITNEGNGWHLHAHVLVNAKWIDASALAVKWGKLVGQEFGIVKVKDARGQDYCNEVTKYVVKGSQLSSWEPEIIAQFIHAIKGVKFFSTFGELFKMRREIRDFLEATKPPQKPCDCGCSDFIYEDETRSICGEIKRQSA